MICLTSGAEFTCELGVELALLAHVLLHRGVQHPGAVTMHEASRLVVVGHVEEHNAVFVLIQHILHSARHSKVEVGLDGIHLLRRKRSRDPGMRTVAHGIADAKSVAAPRAHARTRHPF